MSRTRHLFLMIIITMVITSAFAYDESTYTFTNHQDAARFQVLTEEIRCLVCQNQSIADSNAPLAQDLRHKVYELMKDQQSDAEIKDYLVKRYGEFILLNPRLNKLTILLWSFPVLCLMLVLGVFTYFFKRRTLHSIA